MSVARPPICHLATTHQLLRIFQVQAAERKTAVMRLQNRLQQSFAKKLKPGQGAERSNHPQQSGLRRMLSSLVEFWVFLGLAASRSACKPWYFLRFCSIQHTCHALNHIILGLLTLQMGFRDRILTDFDDPHPFHVSTNRSPLPPPSSTRPFSSLRSTLLFSLAVESCQLLGRYMGMVL